MVREWAGRPAFCPEARPSPLVKRQIPAPPAPRALGWHAALPANRLTFPRGTLLQPADVPVVRLEILPDRRERPAFHHQWHPPRIPPATDFRVPLRKGKPPGAALVIARIVQPPSRQIWRAWPTGHVDEEVPRIQRFFALVPEQRGHCRTGLDQVTHLQVRPPGRTAASGRRLQDLRIQDSTKAIESNAHRQTADTRHPPAGKRLAFGPRNSLVIADCEGPPRLSALCNVPAPATTSQAPTPKGPVHSTALRR